MNTFYRYIWICIVLGVAINPGRLLATAVDDAPPEIRIWAAVGPNEYLVDAKITVKDAKGMVIGRGLTKKNGTGIIRLNKRHGVKYPLELKTRGGLVLGNKFDGQLTSYISYVDKKNQIVIVDLISTIAARLVKKGYSHDAAMKTVRHGLGIGDVAPEHILMYLNRHVDADILRQAVSSGGGYSRFIRRLGRRIDSGEKISELRSVYNFQVKNSGFAKSLASSGSPTCPSIPTNKPGSPSAQQVVDVGIIGMQSILTYFGGPEIAGIAGELLDSLVGGLSPSEAEIERVAQEMTCLVSEMGYLVEEVGAIAFQLDIQSAITCENNLTSPFLEYHWLTLAGEPLDSSNPTLMLDYPDWNPSTIQCGNAINNALFGTAGGQASAWSQLVQNVIGSSNWVTLNEIQQLQAFLAYWGGLEYQQYILTNEYYNLTNQSGLAQYIGGYAAGSGQGVVGCVNGTTASSGTVCAWQSNISSVYPDNIYSDEAGIPSYGIAVSAFPSGLVISGSSPGSVLGQLGYTSFYEANDYWYNTFDSGLNNKAPLSADYPQQQNYESAINLSNSYGVDPGGIGSTTVETFSNPQAAKNYSVIMSQALILNSPGPNGVNGSSFFLSALQGDPTSQWGGISVGGSNFPMYLAYDSTLLAGVNIGNFGQAQAGFNTPQVGFGSISGSHPLNLTYNCSFGGSCRPGGKTAYYSYLLGRNWSMSLNKTSPSVPVNPPTVPSAPTLLSVVVASGEYGSLQLSFSTPNSSGYGLSGGADSIIGYLATCSDGSGAVFKATATTTSVTVAGMPGGITYSCSVQASNSVGYGLSSNSISTLVPAYSLPGAPVLQQFQYNYPFFTLTIAAPEELGTPSVTGYSATCLVTGPFGNQTQTFSGPSSPLTIYNSVAGGTTWTCTVQAVNPVGPGPDSNSMQVTIPPA